MRRLILIAALLMLSAMASHGAAPAPLIVPLFVKAPVIDGKMAAGEWGGAVGLAGFQSGDKLQRRQVRGWIGADETTIYAAVQSQLPAEGPLTAEVKRDSLKAVFDDSLEVYVDPTPDVPDHVDYQGLFNSLGKGGYNIHKTGKPAEAEAWSGGWKVANSLGGGWWTCEIAIPIAKMKMVAAGRKTTDDVWLINLCRNWKQPWEWSSLAPGGGYANSGLRVRFTRAAAPVVQFGLSGDATFPPAELSLKVTNPGKQPLSVKANLDLTRNNMPELKQEQVLKLAAGQSGELKLKLEANDPTTIHDLQARVTSADGQTVYFERALKWAKAKEPLRWVTDKPVVAPAVDFLFAYYPSSNKLRLRADISGLPKSAKLTRLTATVRDRLEGKAVKVVEFPLAGFKEGPQEVTADLPALNGHYEIAMKGEGEGVPATATVKTFERQVFPWENAPPGRSTKVYPPFTPLKVEGRRLQAVLRTHDLNDQGLLDQVSATSATSGVTAPILAAPMRYVAKVDGKEAPVQAQPLKVVSAKENEVVTESTFSAGALSCLSRATWDYDGTGKVELTLQGSGGQPVNGLTLEIPFPDATTPLIHANSDRIRAPIAQKVPAGQGVVWDGSKVACDEFIKGFCPYIYLGSANRGLCWFAENDRNWGWDRKTPNMELVRTGDTLTLRIHLVNQPTVIDKPRTITFGLLAAPVKPRLNLTDNPNGWRYRFMRDKWSILGTDVNWLALGDCGSVYPAGGPGSAGGDMYLWEMLKEGNRRQLSAAEIAQVSKWGEQYYAPYGAERVDTWRRHVTYNLRGRLGTKMMFYYNRATCQLFPELETFKDEWLVDDTRNIGKGNGVGEIKVIPSPSYIDYNLYWYARSFEVGGNQGVYWDNMFIVPSFNTQMTDAYVGADGNIVPAAGLWAMRDLSKRTFVMMNERGIPPVIMHHMTSFSCLPLLSFATTQYDWEWKYGGGDTQDRFDRDYVLLCSTGDLAGVWPVTLGDQSPQNEDPWYTRTMMAVHLLHELDGGMGYGAQWIKAHKANWDGVASKVYAMLDRPGLQVYRYWEERPQPVRSENPELLTNCYVVPGQEALVVLVSYAREDVAAEVKVDLQALGLGADAKVTDAETGAALTLADGKVAFPLKKHDMRLIRIGGG